MRTVTKKELVNRIAEQTGQTKVVAKEIIQAFLDSIIDELAMGNRLEFREFGVFESKERAARRAQNPRTLERVDVPAKRIVKFKVGRLMRQRVSGDDDDDSPLGDDGSSAPASTGAGSGPAAHSAEVKARGDDADRGGRPSGSVGDGESLRGGAAGAFGDS